MTDSCRYCQLPVSSSEAVQTVSYWHAVKFVAHATCLDRGRKLAAFECQCIDADCNDCAFFVRDRMREKNIWEGTCTHAAPNPRPHAQLVGTTVHAFPKFCSDHPCFVHRRA